MRRWREANPGVEYVQHFPDEIVISGMQRRCSAWGLFDPDDDFGRRMIEWDRELLYGKPPEDDG